jgi:hypothetical protein
LAIERGSGRSTSGFCNLIGEGAIDLGFFELSWGRGRFPFREALPTSWGFCRLVWEGAIG